MPSTEKVVKSELSGTIDRFLNSKRKKSKGPDGEEPDLEFLDVIEFVNRFKLLPYGLYPVQKFILKLYYNIPLDNTLPNDPSDRIRITDRLGVKTLFELSEVEYLRYLYSQGRCNIKEQDIGHERRELILCLGRRSGKSTIAAIIAAYEIYKLLRRSNPQAFYGLSTGNEIRILCIANDKEQASIVYGEMGGYVEAIDYFKSSQVSSTQTFMRFQTDQDKKRYGEGQGHKATITATFKSSVAKGLRGRGIMCAILDELAFFIDDGKSSAERIYKAIYPSIAGFSPKDPKNKRTAIGPSEGRIIAISSPDAREGFFYRLYQIAMSNSQASRNMLMVQAPTWEVNPTLHVDYYETEYFKDPKSFDTEHGAEFSDRVRGWIEDAHDLTDCIIPDLRPLAGGVSREPFFAGVDFGIKNDGTAIVLTRLHDGKVELAYHEIWYPRKKWKESNPHLITPINQYALKLQDVPRIDMDEIAEWFKLLASRFFIIKGVIDQYAGHIFEQSLHKRNLTQFEMRNFSVADSSQAFMNTKMMMYAKQLALYDYPLPDSPNIDMATKLHSPLIQEMLELQATSGGKNIMIVEAPQVSGKHDDMSDAYVRSVLLASEYINDHPGILDSTKGLLVAGPERQTNYGIRQFQRMRNRMHGPPPRERTIPGAFRHR
jgi:hypothetical protein